MKSPTFLICFCLIGLVISCKKSGPAQAYRTLITGKVSEGNTGKAIKGARLYIFQFKPGISLQDSTIIDSTFSDPSGHYSLTLNTQNNTDQNYFWRADLDDKYVYNTTPVNIRLGQTNQHDLVAFETSTLKARIIYSNNPRPPLYISTSSSLTVPGALSFSKLPKTAGDTTILVKLIPNKPNEIHFYYLDEANYYWWHDEKLETPVSFDTLTRTFNLDLQKFIRGHKAN